MDKKYSLDDLRRFSKQADILIDDKFNCLKSTSFQVKFNTDKCTKMNTQSPSTDLVKSFILDLRFFILKNTKGKSNKFHFLNICNYFIEKNYKKEDCLKFRDAFNDIMNSDKEWLKIGDKKYSDKTIIQIILGEKFFHVEGNNRGLSFLESNPIIGGIANHQFYLFLFNLRKVIGTFSNCIVKKYTEESMLR